MKNYEAEKILNALRNLSASNTELPVLTAYKIIKGRQKLEDAIKPYLELRDKIILKYDKNGTVTEKTPGFSDCLKELDEIGNEDTELPELEKIKLEDLQSAKMPVNLLSALMPIIEDMEVKNAE